VCAGATDHDKTHLEVYLGSQRSALAVVSLLAMLSGLGGFVLAREAVPGSGGAGVLVLVLVAVVVVVVVVVVLEAPAAAPEGEVGVCGAVVIGGVPCEERDSQLSWVYGRRLQCAIKQTNL
jgi:hypothetical protein